MFLLRPNVVIARPIKIPLFLQGICAGFPSPAEDHIDVPLDLADLINPNPKGTFIWRVDGQSMQDAGIFHGDLIVVDRTLEPRHGDVVVAVVEGSLVTVKRYLTKPGPPRLVFENEDFPVYPLPDDSGFEIWGVVTWNLHAFRGRR